MMRKRLRGACFVQARFAVKDGRGKGTRHRLIGEIGVVGKSVSCVEKIGGVRPELPREVLPRILHLLGAESEGDL
jgi:hypothetical protein